MHMQTYAVSDGLYVFSCLLCSTIRTLGTWHQAGEAINHSMLLTFLGGGFALLLRFPMLYRMFCYDITGWMGLVKLSLC